MITKHKIVKIKDLISLLKEHHEKTIRRDLQEMQGMVSFTHKCQFITLSSIPIFDDNGIWFYENVGFSKFKNSLELILSIIEKSPNGISREELSNILKINIGQQIQKLLSKQQLARVKVGRKYLYIPAHIASNKNKKLKLLRINQFEEYYDETVKTEDLVAILNMALLEAQITLKDLDQLIKKYSLKMSVQKAEEIILKYDLLSKKSL
ncbi:MAG: hypothetical protein ISR65_18865 [Bacteriovoracaceae bacterium]|nr:hypothetical protein [Bacteriovoracaceae bacterium]